MDKLITKLTEAALNGSNSCLNALGEDFTLNPSQVLAQKDLLTDKPISLLIREFLEDNKDLLNEHTGIKLINNEFSQLLILVK